MCTASPILPNLAKERGTTFLLCWPPFSGFHLHSWFKVLFIHKALNGSAHNHNLLSHRSTTRSLRKFDLGHLAIATPRLHNNIQHHSRCGCWGLPISHCHLFCGLARHFRDTSIISSKLQNGELPALTISICLIGQMYQLLGFNWSYMLWTYCQICCVRPLLSCIVHECALTLEPAIL